MVAPLLAAGIVGAGLAAAGGVAGQSSRKTPNRSLNIDPYTAQQQRLQYMQQARSASGMGPSYAELQMQAANEQARRAASSQAASARGANLALAQRAGAGQQAAVQADIAQQAGMARMEEIMVARQQAAQQLQAMRQQDLQTSQINLQAQLARDEMEFRRRQGNKDRLYGALTMGGASVARLGAGGGGN